ncbi:MAG: LPS export ABC transporter permease LptG [Thermodesulfobacteriota bacterium]|nr:MAG: LPS export ABC transporter permease LptG [Thermodesulfobacteriota bacterium]
MKVLQKYLLREFLKLAAIAAAGFVVLFVTVDIFENMDSLMEHKVPLVSAAGFFLYKIPFIISQVLPVALLVATFVSLGLLSRHGEITAVKAGGVRVLRAALPLLAAGLVASAGVILMNEYVTPTAMKKADSFRQRWLGAQEGSFGREGLWIKTSEGILNAKNMDPDGSRLHGVTYYFIGKPFTPTGRVHSRTAVWKGSAWAAEEATVWNFTPGREAQMTERASFILPGLAKPEEMINMESFQRNMGFMDLREYVKDLEKEGYEATRFKTDLWSKLSFPLVNFIMVLVGIPFALRTGRQSGIAAGIGLSIVIAFSYWGVYALTRSLGQSQLVPPFLAAFFPDILFVAIGALMLGYVRE